jgi:Fe-S oxidoreductase
MTGRIRPAEAWVRSPDQQAREKRRICTLISSDSILPSPILLPLLFISARPCIHASPGLRTIPDAAIGLGRGNGKGWPDMQRHHCRAWTAVIGFCRWVDGNNISEGQFIMLEERSPAASNEKSKSPLQTELKNISEKCMNCGHCSKECEFLSKFGTPKEIADSYDPSKRSQSGISFECSLCGLCASVCPHNNNPAAMFLEMRRETATRSREDHPEYKGVLAYERRGTSTRFTYYGLPAGCDTIFFPGCHLPGSRPDTTFKLYGQMKKRIPALGIVLDCCMKISHDLGRAARFTAMFREMKAFLTANGVRNVIVACPNCHRVFKEHGGQLSVQTVYEVLSTNGLVHEQAIKGVVTIHDPCAIRSDERVHTAVRDLIQRHGLTVEEMPHHGENTLCCGEGGFVGCISPALSRKWGDLRKQEANGRKMITYCAGCANRLNGIVPTSHVLDLLFEPALTLAGKERVSRAPMSYINRLRLKGRFRKTVQAAVTRERTCAGGTPVRTSSRR